MNATQAHIEIKLMSIRIDNKKRKDKMTNAGREADIRRCTRVQVLHALKC